MKRNNKGLLDKKRFEWMEKERVKWLQNLTLEESIKITECFLSSNFFSELKNNFIPDNPICLRLALRNRKNVRR